MATKKETVDFVKEYVKLHSKDEARDVQQKAEKVFFDYGVALKQKLMSATSSLLSAGQSVTAAADRLQKARFSGSIDKVIDAKEDLANAEKIYADTEALIADIREEAAIVGVNIDKTV